MIGAQCDDKANPMKTFGEVEEDLLWRLVAMQ